MRLQKLEEQQIADMLRELGRWRRDDEKWISAAYVFPAFTDSIRFVNEIAHAAEHYNHHPLISVDYKRVTLRLTTWNAGGLTTLDFQSASRYDDIYACIRA